MIITSKRTVAVGIVSVAALFAAGCSSSGSDTPSVPTGNGSAGSNTAGSSTADSNSSEGNASFTLNYPSWMWEEGDVGKWLKARVAEFESTHQGVKVQTTQIGVADFENQVSTQISAGQAPDIMSAFTNQVPNLIANDLLAPLNECFANTKFDTDKLLPTVENVTKDGNIYGAPLTMSPQGLIYNKALMDQAGVTKIPSTPDELLEASRLVKEKTGKFGYGLPTDTSDVVQTYIESMKWILGYGSDWSSADGTITANSPTNVDAITTMMKFVDEGLTPKGMNESDVLTLFAEGGVAFLIEGPWAITQVQSESPDMYKDVGFASPPTPTHAAITGGAYWVLPADTEHYDAACDLLVTNLADDAQRDWLQDLLQIPGTKVTPSAKFVEKNPWVAEMADVAAKYPAGLGYAPPGHAVDAAEFQRIAVDSLAKLLAGSQDVQASLDEAQKNLEAAFS